MNGLYGVYLKAGMKLNHGGAEGTEKKFLKLEAFSVTSVVKLFSLVTAL